MFSYFACIFRISSIVFFQQNGLSIWHKRFLRLLCTSKENREILRRFFFPSLYIFFLFLHRQTHPRRLYYTSRPDPPPPTTRVQQLHIFFTLRYKIPLASVHAFFPFRKHNANNRYDAKNITFSLSLCSSRRALHKCVHGQQRVYF